jgi:hypothetical protein
MRHPNWHGGPTIASAGDRGHLTGASNAFAGQMSASEALATFLECPHNGRYWGGICCKTFLGPKVPFQIKPPLENFDSRNRYCGFYYCPFPSVAHPLVEFCNRFGGRSGHIQPAVLNKSDL